MKMSTRCRYGLRALADLALTGGSQPVPLRQIAKRQKLSLKYLEQEFATLRKAGFVRSVKGAQGGYTLSLPASEILVSDIIRQLEGDLLLVDEPVPQTMISPIRSCLYDVLWQPLNSSVEQSLALLTLADLAGDLQTGGSDNPMYYI